MADGLRPEEGRGRGATRGWGVAVAAALLVVPLGACGQEQYEYGERKVKVDLPAAPSHTVDDLRDAAASSEASPQTQMGEDLSLPAGLPAQLPLPSEAHTVNVLTAQPGWFEWSVVLVDPPGPLTQVLRGLLDEVQGEFEQAGVPVRRETRAASGTGVTRDVVDAELDGRAVEISLQDDGYHLVYAVENAR